MLEHLPLAAIAFISTNLDDVFVLLGFFADPAFRPLQVVLGQYLGITTLVAASLASSLPALLIPHAYIGLLGLLPLVIGLKKLSETTRTDHEPKGARGGTAFGTQGWRRENHDGRGGHRGEWGDNVAVCVPTFAGRTVPAIISIVVLFAI